MSLRRRTGAVLAWVAISVCALAATPAAADTTIGADVNQAFNYTGACDGGGIPANRPCTVVNLTTTPARTMQSPCDGTVTRYRLNGTITANTYRIRAVTDNGNGTYTPTATSAPPVTIQTTGVNEFAASMPIKQGQYVGIDFMDNPVVGLRGWGGPGFFEAVFYAFPADGTPDTDTPPPDYAIYLYNADVACPAAADRAARTRRPRSARRRKRRRTGTRRSRRRRRAARRRRRSSGPAACRPPVHRREGIT